jgi:uncharacterized protein (DUF362 family)
MSLVGFVKIRNRNTRQAIVSALNLVNYAFPKNARNIVIKANMCYYWDHSTGQTTDPKFVGALIDLIRKEISADVNVYVVESDASAMKCRHAFKFLGYENLAKTYGVKLVNLTNDSCDPLNIAVNGQSFKFMIPHTIKNSDLRINVTKIKYSTEEVKVTCALKNIFGCNPYEKKYLYHRRINETIVALNKAMPFDLCLIDGNIVYGMNTRKLGLVMASTDPVAIDTAAARVAGVNPNTIGHIRLASREHLGSMQFIPKGVKLDYFRHQFPKRNLQKKLTGQAFNLITLLRLGKKLGLE